MLGRGPELHEAMLQHPGAAISTWLSLDPPDQPLHWFVGGCDAVRAQIPALVSVGALPRAVAEMLHAAFLPTERSLVLRPQWGA